MNSVEARSQIRDYLLRVTRHADLGNDVNIFDSGIVNSIFAIELVAFLEKQFDIKIGNEDLDLANFWSIDALTEFVSRKNQVG